MSNMNTVITEPKEAPPMAEGAPFEQSTLAYGGCGTPILKPNAAYLAATTKMDISELPYGSIHDYITDGDVKIHFSTPLEKRGLSPWLGYLVLAALFGKPHSRCTRVVSELPNDGSVRACSHVRF